FAGPPDAAEPAVPGNVVVFVGRHIPEKRVLAIPPALACARERLPELHAQIFGDGPDRARLLALVSELELGDAVEAPGFVDGDRLRSSLWSALCLLLPSR